MIITSSVGSYRSQYITISTLFTDVFLPSSPHNTSIRRSFRRLCYRKCLIAGTFLAALITAQHLNAYREDEHYLSAFPQYLLPAISYLLSECPHHYRTKRHHHDYVLDALGGQLLFAIHSLPDAPTAHNIG